MLVNFRHPYRCRLCLDIVDSLSENYPGVICVPCTNKERNRLDSNNKKKRIIRNRFGEKIRLHEWLACLSDHGFVCAHCKLVRGRKNLTLDHIIPIGSGGSNTIDNVQPLCFGCHATKDNNTKVSPFSRKKLIIRYKRYRRRITYWCTRFFESLKIIKNLMGLN